MSNEVEELRRIDWDDGTSKADPLEALKAEYRANPQRIREWALRHARPAPVAPPQLKPAATEKP